MFKRASHTDSYQRVQGGLLIRKILLLSILIISLMAFSTVYSNTTNQEATIENEINEHYPIKLTELSAQVGQHTDFPSGNLPVNVVRYEFVFENISNDIVDTLFVFIKADDE
jgi:hypothetical protein